MKGDRCHCKRNVCYGKSEYVQFERIEFVDQRTNRCVLVVALPVGRHGVYWCKKSGLVFLLCRYNVACSCVLGMDEINVDGGREGRDVIQ